MLVSVVGWGCFNDLCGDGEVRGGKDKGQSLERRKRSRDG